MIGFDFNGVVDTGKFIPTKDDVIITGNTLEYAQGVLDWLKEHNIQCPVYFNPYRYIKEDAGMWKSEMIWKLKITKFYEDDPVQYEIIKHFSSGSEIIKV